MEKINLSKTSYTKNQYEKVVDTNFSQLGQTITQEERLNRVKESTISIDQFFRYYKELFYQIPKTGTNSHTYLIKASSYYVKSETINDDIQALINEINLLQQTNLELNERLIELSLTSSQQI